MLHKKVFQERLNLNSDKIFIKDKNCSLSYRNLKGFISKIRTDLEKLNLVHNSLVLVDIRNPIYFIGYVLGCLSLKLRPALLNYYFKPHQIESILKSNSYALFITDQEHPGFKTFKVNSEEPLQFQGSDFTVDPQSELIFFTSGSIKSKACVLTLENFFYNALGSSENIPFESTRTWGLCLPLFHVGGFSILMRAILAEASVAVLENDKLIDQIKQFNVTHISLVSTQFIRYLDQLPQTQLQHILLGGSAIPEVYIKKALDLNLPIYKSYGMTEMASQICTTPLLKKDSPTHSGRLLMFRELKIKNQKIFVRGPCLFKGYLEDDTFITPFDSEGWFSTGDLGEWNQEGLKVLGRADRIFQSGGENISPEVIEQELLKISGVLIAYVIPEVDPEYGMRAVAYIDCLEGATMDSIHSQLQERLSGLYRPKILKPWNQLPKTSWKL